MGKQFFVYILTDSKHKTLYTGVTSNLKERIYQHKEKLTPGFSSSYNTNLLVYYEHMADASSSIAREKQIKGGSREDKIRLINRLNPQWRDLYEQLF